MASMARYRRSLVSFVRTLPMSLERLAGDGARMPEEDPPAADAARTGLTAIDGGRT